MPEERTVKRCSRMSHKKNWPVGKPRKRRSGVVEKNRSKWVSRGWRKIAKN
jgi:hypothetical protein